MIKTDRFIYEAKIQEDLVHELRKTSRNSSWTETNLWGHELSHLDSKRLKQYVDRLVKNL